MISAIRNALDLTSRLAAARLALTLVERQSRIVTACYDAERARVERLTVSMAAARKACEAAPGEPLVDGVNRLRRVIEAQELALARRREATERRS